MAATAKRSRRALLAGKAPAPTSKVLSDNAIVPPYAIRVLNKMAYGPARGDQAYFNSLGATNQQRLEAYVAEQLNPNTIDDSVMQGRLNHPNFVTLNKSLTTLWEDHENNGNSNGYDRPAREVQRAKFLRAIYSKRQLLEMLAEFWHDHFSIYCFDRYARATWVMRWTPPY